MRFKLAANIDLNHAPETDEERYAVRQLKGALNQLGYYIPDPATGMTDDLDDALKDAVYAYQRNAAIFFDDTDLGPDSTTERVLDEDLDYMDRDYLFSGTYIWRTVGDNKVRGEHADRNGQTFLWSDPPDGGHPGEDYNCRCWAEQTNPPDHHWPNWVRERREQRLAQSTTVERLAPLKELKTEIPDLKTPLDAVNPTVSPLDLIGWGAAPAAKIVGREIIAKIAAKQLAREAAKRDVGWIQNANIGQIQHAFKQAKKFGINENWSKKSAEIFRKSLETHVKSPDTKVIKGTYHKKPATHYYNPKTRLNIIRNQDGDFVSAWKLKEKQIFHIENTGDLGGAK